MSKSLEPPQFQRRKRALSLEALKDISLFHQKALRNAHLYQYIPLLSVPTAQDLEAPRPVSRIPCVNRFLLPHSSSFLNTVPLRNGVTLLAILQVVLLFYSTQLVLAATGRFGTYFSGVAVNNNNHAHGNAALYDVTPAAPTILYNLRIAHPSLIHPAVSGWLEMLQGRILTIDHNDWKRTLIDNSLLVFSRILFSCIGAALVLATVRHFSAVKGFIAATLLLLDAAVSLAVFGIRLYIVLDSSGDVHSTPWELHLTLSYLLSPLVLALLLWYNATHVLSFCSQQRFVLARLAKADPLRFGPFYYIVRRRETRSFTHTLRPPLIWGVDAPGENSNGILQTTVVTAGRSPLPQKTDEKKGFVNHLDDILAISVPSAQQEALDASPLKQQLEEP